MTALGWIDFFMGTHSERELAHCKRVLKNVEKLGEKLKNETDKTLKERAQALRERAVSGTSVKDLMVETFSLVREVSFRRLSMRHFDAQILGGAALCRGNIVEMKTGEGKTLVATLPVVLNALNGKGTHVITVNDYLAKRDAEWMAPIYEFMGLSVAVVTEDMDRGDDKRSRKAAYQADITYVTNHELVFDYLRDNLATSRDDQVQRPLNFALVDEVDLLLLDEAGTPLIISGPAFRGNDLSLGARKIVSSLREGEDFQVDYKTQRAAIGENGWSKMEKALKIDNLAAPEHLEWQHALHNALLAHAVYQRDVDYIVEGKEVLLVDDYTGRVSEDKRFSDGLHQALEAKEGVTVRAEDRTMAKASYQMFFRLYPFLCGMTGTAYSAREEMRQTYGLRVVVIPTNKPVARIDEPATVYKSSDEKFKGVVEEIQKLTACKRPVLVGTTSVKESEHVSRLLKEKGIQHNVLNAKDDSVEAAIISQAGRPAAVTVSTNMSGRGVDILLGGNPGSFDQRNTEENRKIYEENRFRVLKEGGLMVIGTGLHESRRIDDQLRGRAGRQGDPGGSHYFLSLDDPIYRKFGERNHELDILKELRNRLMDHLYGEPVTNPAVIRTLRDLQRKVEIENESIRRDVLRYDVVVDHQRRTIYGWRQAVLSQQSDETIALFKEMVDEEETADALRVLEQLSELEAALGKDRLADVIGQIMLAVIDEMWTEHLSNIESLDDAVGLRGYAQVDPLLEFKREVHELYQDMLRGIRVNTINTVMSIREQVVNEN